MYCKNCGNQLSDDAMFCNNCGAPQNQNAQGQTGTNSPPAPPPANPSGQHSAPSGQYSAPSGQYSAPSGQYSTPSGQYSAPTPPVAGGMPPKNNTTKILLISLGGLCVVIAAVLLIVLLKPFSHNGGNNPQASLPSSFQDDLQAGDGQLPDTSEVPDIDTFAGQTDGATLPDDNPGPSDLEPADTDAGPSQPSAPPSAGLSEPSAPPAASPGANTGGSLESLVMFDTPVWSSEPIYKTTDLGGVWTSVGLAPNPDQVSGTDGIFSLDDFEDCMYYVEFFTDLTWSMKYIEVGDTGVESSYWEIMDLEYLDTYDDGEAYGYRFYNGADGRLYMCLWSDMGDGTYPDLSDFVVFERLGDTVNWAAE